MTAAADPAAVLALARAWLGTPYMHQQSVQGAGTDCLGLVRGVWRGLHGAEPEVPPPYGRGWGGSSGRELLLEAARRWLIEVPVAEAGPGAVLLFRMVRTGPARHCAVLAEEGRHIIHAYAGQGVVSEPYTTAWSRRCVAAFLFPDG